MSDPFRHHPGLRALIKPAEESFFRDFQPAHLDARMSEMGVPFPWRYSEDEREHYRQIALADRWDQDLWVFAYGSLIWDPGIRFAEVRRAFVPDHARRFILVDTLGGRGTADRPGLMAALDPGPGCHGLVFRVAAADLDEETRILWKRERLLRTYHETYVTALTDHGPVQALAFTADHGSDSIQPDLPRRTQVEYLATGTGFLGSSLDYIGNLARHFSQMRIADPEMALLLEDARRHAGRLNCAP